MLNIYSSMSKTKSPFKPMQEGKVAMYVCGITVYDFCHIGHAKLLVTFDVVYRHLLHLGYDVRYVRNITDIEDKIFARAKENGEDYKALSDRFIAHMHEDEESLNILKPTLEPRATGFIAEIIALIERLIENGCAYQADNGDVYFELDKFEQYGKLSRRKTEDLLVGDRIDVEKAKKNPLDFVLWKMAKPGEAMWASPWGDGRPGWHIECSAMSTSTLGDTLDIHGGATDLVFPHHENEIAQSEAATGKELANNWMHCGVVRVDKEKMSKSLGNFFTIRDVLKKYHREVIRYFLTASHYRSTINYSDDNLNLAKTELSRFYQGIRSLDLTRVLEPSVDISAALKDFDKRFDESMNDDFNTAKAIAVMFEVLKNISAASDDDEKTILGQCLVRFGQRLGFLFENAEDFFKNAPGENNVDAELIEQLIVERKEVRENKNWARADEIRDELDALGVLLEDLDGKTTWKLK